MNKFELRNFIVIYILTHLHQCHLSYENGGLIFAIMKEYFNNLQFIISLFIEENRNSFKRFVGVSEEDRVRQSLEHTAEIQPNNSIIWIILSRFERFHQKIEKGKKIIKRGCELNPENYDLWIEAMTCCDDINYARSIYNEAVHHVSESIMFWISALNFEYDNNKKLLTFRKACESLPNLGLLWETLLLSSESSDSDNIKNLLMKALTNCDTTSVELWLTLAKLESSDNKKIVFEKATTLFPECLRLWLIYANVEGVNPQKNQEIIDCALMSFADNSVEIVPVQWIYGYFYTSKAEKPFLTYRSIITSLAGHGEDYTINLMEFSDYFFTEESNMDFDNCHELVNSILLQVYPQQENCLRTSSVQCG